MLLENKISPQFKVSSIIGFGILFFLSTETHALEAEISTEAIYEHSSEKMVIDGLSSRYSIGAIGLNVALALFPDLNFDVSYGFGYLPEYEISSSGISFTGPVDGFFSSYGAEYTLIDRDFKVLVDFLNSERSIKGTNFKGMRSGQEYTLTSDAQMRLTEYAIKYQRNPIEKNSIGIKVGLSFWNFNALGVAFQDDIMIRKYSQKTGSSPVFGIYGVLGGKTPLEYTITRRTYSADNFIESYELKLRYMLSN